MPTSKETDVITVPTDVAVAEQNSSSQPCQADSAKATTQDLQDLEIDEIEVIESKVFA